MISALIDSNNKGFHKIILRQNATKELVRQLPASLNTLRGCLNGARDQPSNNIQTFRKIPVSRYCSTTVDGKTESTLVPTPDLDIYRLKNQYPYPGKRDGDIGGSAGFLVSQSSQQKILQHVSDLLARIQHLQQLKQKFDDASEADDPLEAVEELTGILANCKRQQIRDFQSILLETETCRKQCLDLCEAVDHAFQDFNVQAAQKVIGNDEQ